MKARCWINGENMPPNHEFEVYHATNQSWKIPLFHSHDTYEFYFFIRGDMRIGIEGEIYTAIPYDMFIYPPGYMHSVIPGESEQSYERAYFYLRQSLLERMSTLSCDLSKLMNGLVAQNQLHFHLLPETFHELVGQMDQIIANADDERSLMEVMNRSRMEILLASCFQAILTQSAANAPEATTRIGKVLEYINAHFSEPLSTEILAEKFFINKYYLMHAFKEYTNTSIHQYVMAKRIIQAQLMIQQGVPAGELCAKCGFGDYAGFYRAFKARVGMTPQQYAKNYQ